MFTKILKTVFIIFLVYLTYRIFNKDYLWLLSAANLNFHEAGHTIFSFFGKFIYILGGTLGQLLVPVVFGVYFLRRQEWFSVQIMTWWFGQNLTEVGIYMADARVQVLPLLGGDKAGHDWTNLFTMMDVLGYDVVIGNLVWRIGVLVMIVVIGFSIWSIWGCVNCKNDKKVLKL